MNQFVVKEAIDSETILPSLCSEFLWESQRDKTSTYRLFKVQHNLSGYVSSAEMRTRL